MHKNQKLQLHIEFDLEINKVLYSEVLTGRSLYKVYNHNNALYYTVKIYDLSKNIEDDIQHEMTSLNRMLNLPGIFPKYHHLKIDKEKNEALLLMDWIEGTTLQQSFSRPPKDHFDVKVRLNFMQEICNIVDKIHASHLSHRDLKPDNIIVRSKKDPKNGISIIDFGLSASKPREMEGTIGYRSPEQEFGIGRVSYVSDVFALGQISYWMLTGKPFYAEHQNYEKWYEPNFDININGVDNHLLLPYFQKVLAFNPKERYQSVKELKSAIETIKRSLK